eukprot:TRINITY_DN4700_c0_g1_i20.p1 TRINITY_DN4700_c0_g1~~TRINITY_DN4700_c0_g1_i20.p1  ORF type:complete len:325 (+),score=61.46 TRINITY_DN4700_c0_g1_i20:547-1521(+)
MYTSGEWKGLHFVETNDGTLNYLKQVRLWLDEHPQEIVVIWISKHGGACDKGNDQYPGVSVQTKRDYWEQILQLFSGLVLDTSRFSVNTSTIIDLVASNQRLVIYAADWEEFTGNSTFAYDSCTHLDNDLSDNGRENLTNCIQTFHNAQARRGSDKLKDTFYLVSLASGESEEMIKYAFLIQFFDIEPTKFHSECASYLHIPNETQWCPEHLKEISQLDNFYNQVALDVSLARDYFFPNAIYIDALDQDGSIQIGESLDFDEGNVKYAYSYTLILSSVNLACATIPSEKCSYFQNYLIQLRNKYPLQRWEDGAHGRHTDWPTFS